MEQYDVGIFGLWYGRNYGSISTYFALKTVVEQLGYSTVMIENPLNSDSLDIDSLPMSHPRRFALSGRSGFSAPGVAADGAESYNKDIRKRRLFLK